MEYQEAIEILKKNKPTSDPRRYGEELCTACDVAISAMQELHALHDQGISLKCLGNIGFRKEVIEHINYVSYKDLKDELEQYKQFGTLEEVREAVEKQNAKKPEKKKNVYARGVESYSYHCPCCKLDFINKDDTGFYSGMRTKYCPDCGGAIDWGEEG